MDNLWINKHRPSELSELIGNKNQIKTIKKWIEDIDDNHQSDMTLILSGNHGIGKSLAINYILEEKGYKTKVIYPNDIKDYRNVNNNSKKFEDFYNYNNSIQNTMGLVIKNSKKKIAIIFEETETITLPSEKKFIKEINKTNNKKKSFPLIFICNNKHSKLINNLGKNCVKVKFTTPSQIEIRGLINNIFEKEGITVEDEKVYDEIINFSQHDIRKIINNIQDLSYHYKNITLENFKDYMTFSKTKIQDSGLIETTFDIVNAYKGFDKIVQSYEEEKVLLPLMIHENYIKKSIKNIEDMRKISDSISIGDNVETSIYTDQNWFLIKIHCFFSCIYSTYYINKNKNKKLNRSGINFCSDLNKTSLKNINRKNINTLLKLLSNKSLDEIMYINKISNYLVKNNRTDELVNILKEYDINITVKQLELCLKIDKTVDFETLDTKEKKEVSKLLF